MYIDNRISKTDRNKIPLGWRVPEEKKMSKRENLFQYEHNVEEMKSQ